MRRYLLSELIRHANHCRTRDFVRDSIEQDLRASRYTTVLSAAFDVLGRSGKLLKLRTPGDQGLWQIQAFFSGVCAPECCALIAALGMSFELAAKSLRTGDSASEPRMGGQRLHLQSISINAARKQFAAKAASNPRRPSQAHPRLYWFLRLKDPLWLQRNFPGPIESEIPSIDSDRKKIASVLRDVTKSPDLRLGNVQSYAAVARARVRDGDWLHTRLNKLRRMSETARLAHAELGRRARVVLVAGAVLSIINAELVGDVSSKPRNIYQREIASVTALSRSQVGDVIRSNEELRMAIAILNEDRFRRQLLGALRQLQDAGKSLSVKTICNRAGLAAVPEIASMVQEVILGRTRFTRKPTVSPKPQLDEALALVARVRDRNRAHGRNESTAA
ncbi:MAG: hypothetical protein ROO76_10220 [Terriglobia bacterium]|nr:hypothetical protein [Terriglobia bacterium]